MQWRVNWYAPIVWMLVAVMLDVAIAYAIYEFTRRTTSGFEIRREIRLM